MKINRGFLTIALFLLCFFITKPVHSEEYKKFLFLPYKYNPALIQGWIYSNKIEHRAIDYDCEVGDPLFVAADGIAMSSIQMDDPKYSFGNFVLINHENGYATLYAHLNKSSNNIKFYIEDLRGNTNYPEWTAIKKGDYLGDCGMTGTTNPHLHFEVTKGKYATGRVDPYDLYTTSGYYYPNSLDIGVGENNLWESIPPDFIQNIEDKKPNPTQKSQTLYEKLKTFFILLFTQENSDMTLGKKIEDETIDSPSAYVDADIMNEIEEIYVIPNEAVNLKVNVKNTGNVTWQQKYFSINVVGGIDKNKIYKHESWITDLRTTVLDQTSVKAGEEGSFSFTIRAPDEIGEYTLQAMIVRQQGYTFSWVGKDIFEITMHVGEGIIVEDVQNVVDDKNEIGGDMDDSFIYKVKKGIKGIKETSEDVVDDIVDKAKKIYKYFGGGGESPVQTTVIDPEGEAEPEPEPEVQLEPDIIILFPTSTPYTTTVSSTIIFGSYNDDVAHVWVNDAMVDDMAYDNEHNLWYFTTDLAMATNTFSFVGWTDDFSTSSESHEIDIIRKEIMEEEEIILPEISITTPSTTPWTVTSTDFIFYGTFNSLTIDILVNSTTTLDLNMNTSTYTWTLPVTVSSTTSTYNFVAIDNSNNTSATTSVVLFYEKIEEEEETGDTEPPVVTLFEVETFDDKFKLEYEAEDEVSGDNILYEVGFMFGLDALYFDDMCGEGSNILEMISFELLADVDNFLTAVMNDPCVMFVTSTKYTSFSVDVASGIKDFAVRAQVSAMDEAENMSDTSFLNFAWEENEDEVAVEGNIVISEIAWMGTDANSNDEWFEICNVDEIDIDVSDWYVSLGNKIIIISSLLLSKGDCLVFERTNQTTISGYDMSFIYTGSMNNKGEHIILYSSLDTIMDEIDASSGWFAGDNDTKDTLIRINPAIFGNDANNWCSFSSCPEASLRGTQSGLDADGNEILGSVGNMEEIYAAY